MPTLYLSIRILTEQVSYTYKNKNINFSKGIKTHYTTVQDVAKIIDVDIGPAGSTYFRYRYRKRACVLNWPWP